MQANITYLSRQTSQSLNKHQYHLHWKGFTMLRTRGKKVFADILARKGHSALVILSIMIGVFGVTTLVGMNDLVVSQLNNDLKPEHIAMTHIYVDTPGQALSLEENQQYIDLLGGLPNVTDVEGQAIYFAYWQKAGADADAKFTESNILSYTEPFGQVDLEPISRVVEGNYPQAGQHQVAVDVRFADKYDVGLGDKLVFRQLDGSPDAAAEWTISGIVFQPYFTISPSANESIPGEDNIFASYEDAQVIANFAGLSSFYLRYTDVEASKDGEALLKATISDQTPYESIFTFYDNPDESFIITQVKNVTSILNILAAVSMIVSGFLVTNVINTIVIEQKQQIGVMKSLGATRMDNFVMYCGMALVYGIVGTAIGIPMGIFAGTTIGIELAPLAETYITGFPVSIVAVVIGIVLGLAVPIIASLVPVFNGTRVTILDAMTDLGISSKWGKGPLSRLIGALPLPINIRQALSNLAQKKGRLALTGLTLTLAVAAFMGVTAVFVALGDELDSLFDTLDYEVAISTQQSQDLDIVRNLLVDNFDEVEDVYAGFSVAAGIDGYTSENDINAGSNQLIITGIDPASPVIKFDLEVGEGWQNDPTRDGIVITRSLADTLDKDLGDSVTMTFGGTTASYEIIGIDGFPGELILMDWRELATRSGFVDTVTGEPLPSDFFIKLAGDPSVDSVDVTIDGMTELLLANGITASYTNQPQVAEDSAEQINLFGMIFNMTSGVMAAVGAIGLLATLSMAVYERQKEIGVMRSVGAGSWTIVIQFLVEGILVGILAWIVAIPLSILLGNALSSAMDFGSEFNFSYPPQVLLMGIVGVIVIASVASIWPSVAAGRKTVSDILRYQ
jgi:putative ABC transport system permease protein